LTQKHTVNGFRPISFAKILRIVEMRDFLKLQVREFLKRHVVAAVPRIAWYPSRPAALFCMRQRTRLRLVVPAVMDRRKSVGSMFFSAKIDHRIKELLAVRGSEL
jgi:hypothetical protein